MKSIKIRLDEVRTANLRLLAEKLAQQTPPPRFTMGSFMRVNREIVLEKYGIPAVGFDRMSGAETLYPVDVYTDESCGTTACAVGHGPLYGIERRSHETWRDYSYRVFLPPPSEAVEWREESLFSVAWEWCFGGGWERTDNTPQGAAARILWLLEHGLPDDANLQQGGRAPLCYTVDAVPESA